MTKGPMQNITETCVMLLGLIVLNNTAQPGPHKNRIKIKGRRDPPRSDIFRRYSAACRGWRNALYLSLAE